MKAYNFHVRFTKKEAAAWQNAAMWLGDTANEFVKKAMLHYARQQFEISESGTDVVVKFYYNQSVLNTAGNVKTVMRDALNNVIAMAGYPEKGLYECRHAEKTNRYIAIFK